MIAHTALLLLIIGLFNCCKFSVKADKFFCAVTLLALLCITFWFAGSVSDSPEQIFSFLWNSSPSGDLKIDIISNSYTCGLFLPFLVISTLAICANFSFKQEQNLCNYNALLLFNLLALLLMITSNNFVQLLSAFFLIDILAVIKAKTDICKKFIILNLCADMLIFMLLALINGHIHSFDIREIINYKNTSYHLDFIAILGFTSILMKMGFFPFQIGLTSLDKLNFQRLLNILCLFSPVSAIIILLKFSSLWSSSEYFVPYLNALCIAALIWSSFMVLCIKNLRLKVIYWQIMIFALMLELLRFHGFVWDWSFSKILLANYILLSGIYLLYNQCKKDVVLQNIAIVKRQKVQNLIPVLLLICSAILSHINNFEILYNNRNRYYIWTYAVFFLLSFCGTLHEICFISKGSDNLSVEINNKSSHNLFVFLSILVCIALLYQFNPYSINFWILGGTFIFLSLSKIAYLVCKTFQKAEFQNYDWFERIYMFLFIYLLQGIGRLLWLIIDWKLVEKFATGIILGLWYTCLRVFRSIQNNILFRFCFVLVSILTILFLTVLWEAG